MQERLQKIIARAGVTSRRAAEELITGGRVRVNGRVVTELGAKADPREDKVEVDGKRLTAPTPVYVVLHKPRNVVSTLSDPEGRPSVAELLANVGARVFPVGRLDFATSGVLLATNDGDFSQGLLHPKKGVPKTYVVKTHGRMEPADLERWAAGVDLDDGRTQPADVHFLRHEDDKSWFEITIFEGRNQQIRRMGEATGFPVMRLARLSFAGVTHDDLRPGQWRFLTASELLDLRKEYGVPKRVRSADTSSGGRVFGKVVARGESRTGRAPRADRSESPRARREHAAHEEAPRRAPRAHDDRPAEAPRQAPRAHEERSAEAPRRAPRPHEDGPRRAPRAHEDRSAEAPRRAARPHEDGPRRAPRAHEDRSAEAPRRAPRPHEDGPRRAPRAHEDRSAEAPQRAPRATRGEHAPARKAPRANDGAPRERRRTR